MSLWPRLVTVAAHLLALPFAAGAAGADFSPDLARSASGQFVVTFTPETSRIYRRPEITNGAFLNLQAPLLAISAERFKAALWGGLGIPAGAPWSGRVFIDLHPVRSVNEPAVLSPQPFIRTWNCRIELPDRIHRDRFARALSMALLLELANRSASPDGKCAEIPLWLADGMAQEVLGQHEDIVILTAPTNRVNNIMVTRVAEQHRGMDPLADARRALQNSPALTFEQLSWPTDAQLNSEGDRTYLASAQLFTHELIRLKNGREMMRAFLEALPSFENWQSAFFKAFDAHFRSPLDVEKWWALRIVSFASRNPGPQWNLATSHDRLNSLLLVSAEIRAAPDALPARSTITLQSALRQFSPAQQVEVLRAAIFELQLAQLRMHPALAAITAEYRKALETYLGERKPAPGTRPEALAAPRGRTSTVLKKLDELDARRRILQERLESKSPKRPGAQAPAN